MKHEIGDKVVFIHEIYNYRGNVELEYEGSVKMSGIIISLNEDDNTYVIEAQNGIAYTVEESSVISSTKLNELKKKLIEQKIKIANAALKMRNALWDDHPAHLKESTNEYKEWNEKLFDLMSEYDDLEDEYIMRGGEKNTYSSMEAIKCFNCDQEFEVDIRNALDENGVLFQCPNCGKLIIYGE